MPKQSRWCLSLKYPSYPTTFSGILMPSVATTADNMTISLPLC